MMRLCSGMDSARRRFCCIEIISNPRITFTKITCESCKLITLFCKQIIFGSAHLCLTKLPKMKTKIILFSSALLLSVTIAKAQAYAGFGIGYGMPVAGTVLGHNTND